MAPSFITKHSLSVLALISVFIFPYILGKTDEYIPQTGAEGSVYGDLPQTGDAGEHVPQTGDTGEHVPQTGDAGEHIPQTGDAGEHDPAEVVAKALLCFNDDYVYSSCEEAYRLTASGNIHVPPEYTDQYCSGACLSETHLVLNCIDNILSHFHFYNRASILDVKETIKAGCSYGPKRGDFNVVEHIKDEENSAQKGSKSVLLGLLLMIIYIYMGYNVLV